ncbi:MAG: SsrA-binding protein SmpB [Abditibacteriales bacterium]|nr:SsrA-binding protein SmpB [Abditibacteriales bacterium]MDW8366367.1 SsrA-binding protein SmpB [Abditibacteriales bacterium]
MAKKTKDNNLIAVNRRARHEYDIIETYEAGLVLTGPEVKSLRAGRVSLQEAFARIDGGEGWLYGMHIAPYEQAHHIEQNPTRVRKLLLHKQEIGRLAGKTQQRGLTLIPLKLYFKRGYAKVELGVARGRKLHDKRRVLAERDARREMERAVKSRL